MIAALLLTLVQATPERVAELIRQLSDEAIEERDAAEAALLKAGEGALGPLRERTRTADDELKARIARLITAIEKQGRLQRIFGDRAAVSLELKNATLDQILAEIAKSGVRVSAPPELGTERVSVTVRDASPWRALEELCRAHGSLWFSDPARATLARGKPAAGPVHEQGVFTLSLDRLEFRRSTDFAEPGDASSTATLFLGWCSAARPMSVSIAFKEFVDDKGTDLRGTTRGGGYVVPTGDAKSTSLVLRGHGTLPADGATKITLSGEVSATFAVTYETVTLVEPSAGKSGTIQRGSTFSATLQTFAYSEAAWRVVLVIELSGAIAPPGGPLEVATLKDSTGKVWTLKPSLQRGRIGRVRRGLAYALECDAPEKTDWSELHIRLPKETHTEVVPFQFKDVAIE
jgi:hypothetical protein